MGRYRIVKGLLQSDSVEDFMNQPQDVKHAYYERVFKSSGFVRWESGSVVSEATLLSDVYSLFDCAAEYYFLPEDRRHPEYTKLVTEAREYIFSNNAFEIEAGLLDEFLEIPRVHQWLRQIRITIDCENADHSQASSIEDIFLTQGGDWQEHYYTIRDLLEDCEQLDWVLIQIWPEFASRDDCVDEAVDEEKGKDDKGIEDNVEPKKEADAIDDEYYDDHTDDDDMVYDSEDYHNEGDNMVYTYGISYGKVDAKDNHEAEEDKDKDKSVTHTASYDWLTRRKIQAWLVAKRRAQDVIDMLRTWGPTTSPLSSIVFRQFELYKKGAKKRSAKQIEELEDNRGESNKGQQQKRRPQRGVYVEFNGKVIYGYYNEAVCHIGGGPDLESLTCCCWSNLGLDKEIGTRNEDDRILTRYTSLQTNQQDREQTNALFMDLDSDDTRILPPWEMRTRTEFIDRLKAGDLLRPDLEAELRRLDLEIVGTEMLDFEW